MSIVKLGDAWADLGPGGDGQRKSVRIGTAFTDETQRVVVKLDTLPLQGIGWQGWINVRAAPKVNPDAKGNAYEDDIFF